ncbi:flagellar hook-associated protein FlgK [Parashewanella curva]|uniref:Flagellar hook-associated protein 1 n=1 Tax=Parashewanella curva TaxID=2338552 RepID=A0A3L8Q1T6_9GAMM|nr:flagellar hook-associated protein FlgK [Parashewanella curva]RLV61565.1 flagellar hook-associated protein FlgK [Parashewanella curva]
MSNDLMNIARNGVLTSQSQLSVTSNNIANVNTDGYNRQVATQSTLDAHKVGNHFMGSGSYVSDVKRIYNEFATRELRIGATGLSEAQTRLSKMNEMDQLFSQIGKAIPDSLNDFQNNINRLGDTPDDLGIRTSILSSAKHLANTINQMDNHLSSQFKSTNGQIDASLKRINTLTQELGNINQELMEGNTENSQLLDKQDSLLKELSEYANINVIPLEGGGKSVMLGGSVALVSGAKAMQLESKTGDPFPNETRLVVKSGDNETLVSSQNLGGQLGGLFEFRQDTLISAKNELGQFALGIADAFNQVQAKGIDLNGQVGKPIFQDINDPAMSNGRAGKFDSNTGTASLSVNIDDVTKLTGAEYELSFDGTDYKLTDKATGKAQNLSLDTSTTPNQLTGGDGFSIQIKSGAFANKDKFTIRPTSGAASGIEVAIKDPKDIAAGKANITEPDSNSGNTKVKLRAINDRNAANFPKDGQPLTFEINTSTTPKTFTVIDKDGKTVGTANQTFTGNTIKANGIEFEVTSTAGSTDKFTFDLSVRKGDNRNAVEMAKLSTNFKMNNGSTTLIDVFQNTKQDIGSQTSSAEIQLNSATAVFKQAETRVLSESGVNLDEEAANLMRFQKSYQASARVMTVANQVFDSLLSAVR